MEESTIELRELFQILLKRIWLIVLIPFVFTLASGVISYFVLTPIYESSTQLLVNKKETTSDLLMPNYNDIQSNLKLIETYNVVIKSPRILDVAIENLNLDMTAGQLSSKIRVSAVQNSQVMSITVTDPDPERAVTIANGIAETFTHEIKNIMNVDNVQVLAVAKLAPQPSPVKPQPMLNMVIAFVVGLMAAVGIAFLLEYLDNTIKSEQDVENILGLSVLGTIATIDFKAEDKLEKDTAVEKVGGNHIEA